MKLRKTRIVERTFSNKKTYIIQQKHDLFFWWWVDAWINSYDAGCTDYFDTLEEAKENLHLFNGTKAIDRVVHEGK